MALANFLSNQPWRGSNERLPAPGKPPFIIILIFIFLGENIQDWESTSLFTLVPSAQGLGVGLVIFSQQVLEEETSVL